MRKLIVDIDGTICTNTAGEYPLAIPFKDRIKIFNRLYDEGNTIVYFTARGATTKIDWTELTTQQLNDWGAKHHELLMNVKPAGDLYIDDRAVLIDDFIKSPDGYVKNSIPTKESQGIKG